MKSATVARRWHRDIDWVRRCVTRLFDVSDRLTYRWVRETTVDQWLAHNGSHSYISSLREPDRVALLADVAKTVKHHFPGQMQVPYETWLWIATKRYDPPRSKP